MPDNEQETKDEATQTMEGMASAAPVPLDPEDLESFAVKEVDLSVEVGKKLLTVVPVRKPPKDSYIRTHPDPERWKTFNTITTDEGETYLVKPDVAQAIAGEAMLGHSQLIQTIDTKGNTFLWPIRVTDQTNDWNESARQGAEAAREDWVRIVSNRTAGYYQTMLAANQDREPKWPDVPFNKILVLAFKGKIIEDISHPLLSDLRGE